MNPLSSELPFHVHAIYDGDILIPQNFVVNDLYRRHHFGIIDHFERKLFFQTRRRHNMAIDGGAPVEGVSSIQLN